MKINSRRLEPKSNKPNSIVFFIHGYGADGADLLSIGDALSEHLPNTLFVAPDAPWKCSVSPSGFQWFPIPWLDGSSETEAAEKLALVSNELDTWIDRTLEKESVMPKNAILFGFSQGTMLSLHIGPRRQSSFGGIIGCSGKIIDIDFLRRNLNSRPPVLLIHGENDDVVDPSFFHEASRELESLEFDVKKHMSPGIGHGISSDGLRVALDFLVNLE